MRPYAVALTIGVALVTLMTGCSADSTPRPADAAEFSVAAPSPLPSLPVRVRPQRAGESYDPSTYANSPLPLDTYRVSPRERAVISSAAVLVANRCRQSYGLEPTLKPYRASQVDSELARRYSIVRDVPTARRWGYHLARPADSSPASTASAPPATVDENLVDRGTLDGSDDAHARPSQKVNGRPIPEGGCVTEGLRAVGQDLEGETPGAVLDAIQHEAYDRAMADAAVRAAVQRWAVCMRAAGYDVAAPLDVEADITTPEPSPQEIRQAVVDAGCAQRADLFDIALRAEVAAQRVAITEHREQLTASRRHTLGELAVARRLLANR